MAIRLAYDTTLPFISNGTLHREDDTITIRYVHGGPIRYDNDSTFCVFYRWVVNISPQETEVSWAFKNALLVYGIMIIYFWVNSPFCMSGGTLVIQETSKFKTFLCRAWNDRNISLSYANSLWLQWNCQVHNFCWCKDESSTLLLLLLLLLISSAPQ